MNVGAVGAVGSGAAPVYAAFSPFLNGVRRTSNAAAAAQLQASAAATSAAATAFAVAARAQAAATVTAAPPFLNPAITEIANLTALGETLTPPVATTPNALLGPPLAPAPASPADSVLHGDGGTLVQSYGAVALAGGPLAPASIYGRPATPAVPAVAPVTALPRVARIETGG
jgi:hypothetical protein